MKLWIFVFLLDTVCSSITTMTPPTVLEEYCEVPLVIFGCFISIAIIWVWVCKQFTLCSLSKTFQSYVIQLVHQGLVIATSSVIESPSLRCAIGNVLVIRTYSLSEKTRYRHILVIGTYSLSEQFLGNNLAIKTALCDLLTKRTRYRNNSVVLLIR